MSKAVRVLVACVLMSVLFSGCQNPASGGGSSGTVTTPTTTATSFDNSNWTGSMTVTSGSNVGSTGSMTYSLGAGLSNVYQVSNLSIGTLLTATWTTDVVVVSGTTMTLSAVGTSTSTPNYSGTACKVTLGFEATMVGYTSGTGIWTLIEYQPNGTTVNKTWTATLALTRN